MKKLFCLLVLLVFSALLASGAQNLKLAAIFTDGMVLQRDHIIPIWGWGNPTDKIRVQLNDAVIWATPDKDGKWIAKLPPIKAGGPYELKVTGSTTVILKDVLIGDVWICSGQSNMEFGLGGSLGAEDDIRNADLPQVRFAKIGGNATADPVADVVMAGPWAKWTAASPSTAMHFPAIGFYFAREVNKATGIPIGLIDTSWSGTFIGPWWNHEGLASVPELKSVADAINKQVEDYRKALPAALDARETWLRTLRQALADKGEAALKPETIKSFTDSLNAQETWVKATRLALAGDGKMPPAPGLPGDLKTTIAALSDQKDLLTPPALPPNDPADVSSAFSIYNGRISPLIPFAMKGVLWYQGENNGFDGGDSYYYKMLALINGWRTVWSLDFFPFYYVQLTSWQPPNPDPAGGDGWANVRDAQTKALSIRNTGMAVTIDVGDTTNIHPTNKYDVGHRLALWALNKTYGLKDIVYSGPMFRQMKIEDNKIRLSFDYVGSGLMVATKEGRQPPVEDNTGKLARFAIAGEDKVWQWADARIDGDTVVVSSEKVPKPVAVRYAYSWNPIGANLYNKNGLPTCPFRTDKW